ncbi:uncharacterized protein LOC143303751 isoform X2 [Bombus vancouverensis nearcticus]|uniref:uncharacterized protein LOC143303751 isoform X2 n=1 Tax=Bombus vancouverensis nearcticus TaxID=2705178 RepID=UPI00402B1F02
MDSSSTARLRLTRFKGCDLTVRRGILIPRGGQGHSAAHAGALSGVGAAPLHPAARHRRKTEPLGDCRSDVERPQEYEAVRLLFQNKGEKEKLVG